MIYILLAIAFERFAFYLMLGELAVWQGPGAVGNLLAAAYLLPLLGGLPLDSAVQLSVGICFVGGVWFYLTTQTQARAVVASKECEA